MLLKLKDIMGIFSTNIGPHKFSAAHGVANKQSKQELRAMPSAFSGLKQGRGRSR